MFQTPIFIAVVGVSTIAAWGSPPQPAQAADSQPASSEMHGMNMGHMPGHMYMIPLRPLRPGDQQKANSVAAKARLAMQPFLDYRQAQAAGFEIFRPEIPQHQYHFNNYRNGKAATVRFDPSKPTSLLYTKTPDGGFKLVGVMYTDRVDAPESELDRRIPLSIARWHQHINYCEAPSGQQQAYFGPNAKFGLQGSIITRSACEAAGGTFHPHRFGWMVHIYPFETDPGKIWSIDDDEDGHDRMDRSPMPAMKMD